MILEHGKPVVTQGEIVDVWIDSKGRMRGTVLYQQASQVDIRRSSGTDSD